LGSLRASLPASPGAIIIYFGRGPLGAFA